MSVYTHINHSQLEHYLSDYNLGTLVHFEGIVDGINNSNYFVETRQGHFVLTLFESLTASEVPVFLNLLSHLAARRIPCPTPIANRLGQFASILADKPAVFFKCLPGKALCSPNIDQCRQIGQQLANIHCQTQNYSLPIKNNYDLSGCKKLFAKLSSHISEEDRLLIQDELAFQASNSAPLPQGVIHADLFRDNVLFDGQQLSGILDFYSACHGTLLFDVAITVNDWCCEQGSLVKHKATALMAAYQNLRPLTALEEQHWQTMLRAAALRFWLSRLAHQIFTPAGELVQLKDPLYFKRLLEQHRQP